MALRKRFTVSEEQLGVGTFVLLVRIDDGFCAYVNGVEVARDGCPDTVAWDQLASVGRLDPTELLLILPREAFRAGENVLAVAGFNRRLSDSDFDIAPRLIWRVPTDEVKELIVNPGFEETTEPWLLEGTHSASDRVTTDARTGQACLEIVAAGKGDSLCNRVEIDTSSPLEDGEPYSVSLWTRWLRGGSLLVAHADFSEGPWPGNRDRNLSGNPLAARLRLTVPLDLGTPGAKNSATTRLEQRQGGNSGPVIRDVLHSPPSPSPGTAIRVDATVADADGVALVQALEPLWISATRWRQTLSLGPKENRFEFTGFDASGAAVAATAIAVERVAAVEFVRGDVTGDLKVNVADPVVTLAFLFQRELITCRDAADFDDDGTVNLTDAVAGLEHIFLRGTPPPPPFPAAGVDATADALDCAR